MQRRLCRAGIHVEELAAARHARGSSAPCSGVHGRVVGLERGERRDRDARDLEPRRPAVQEVDEPLHLGHLRHAPILSRGRRRAVSPRAPARAAASDRLPRAARRSSRRPARAGWPGRLGAAPRTGTRACGRCAPTATFPTTARHSMRSRLQRLGEGEVDDRPRRLGEVSAAARAGRHPVSDLGLAALDPVQPDHAGEPLGGVDRPDVVAACVPPPRGVGDEFLGVVSLVREGHRRVPPDLRILAPGRDRVDVGLHRRRKHESRRGQGHRFHPAHDTQPRRALGASPPPARSPSHRRCARSRSRHRRCALGADCGRSAPCGPDGHSDAVLRPSRRRSVAPAPATRSVGDQLHRRCWRALGQIFSRPVQAAIGPDARSAPVHGDSAQAPATAVSPGCDRSD